MSAAPSPRAKLGFALGLGLILLLGAGLRLLYGLELAKTPGFAAPQNDPQAYLQQAQELEGSGWEGPPHPYFKAPFYPYWLATLLRLGVDPRLWGRIWQWGLGLASALLAGALTRELGGDRLAALIATALLAWTGIFIYFEGELLITAWVVFFDLAGMLLLLRAERLAKTWSHGAAGLLFGLSAIARPTILVFAGLIPLLLAWRGAGGMRIRLRRALLFTLALALPIVPVSARNLLIGDDLVLISSQGGIAFYTGNNPASDGMFGSPAGFKIIGGNWEYYDCVRLAEQRRGRSLRPSEVSRFFVAEGLQFWLDQPLDAVRLWLRKALLFSGRPRISNNQSIGAAIAEVGRGHGWRFLFAEPWELLIFVVGLTGLVRPLRGGTWLRGFALVYSLTVISYFIATRYRIPLLAMLAAPAALWLRQPWPQPRRRNALVAGAALLGLLALWPDWLGIEQTTPAQAHFARGASLLELGRHQEARRELEETLRLNPDYPRVWLNLSVIARAEGEVQEAREALQEELRRFPDDPLAQNNLGALCLEAGELEAALAHFQRAGRLQPNYIRALRNEALTWTCLEQDERALAVLARALEICAVPIEYRPDEVGVRSDRAAILARNGRLRAAEEEYRRALGINPERLEPRLGLGSVLGRLGRWEEAESELRAVLERDPQRFEAHIDLGNVLHARGARAEAEQHLLRATELAPDRPESWFARASLAAERGELDQARQLLQSCLRVAPDFAPARRALEALSAQMDRESPKMAR